MKEVYFTLTLMMDGQRLCTRPNAFALGTSPLTTVDALFEANWLDLQVLSRRAEPRHTALNRALQFH